LRFFFIFFRFDPRDRQILPFLAEKLLERGEERFFAEFGLDAANVFGYSGDVSTKRGVGFVSSVAAPSSNLTLSSV